MQDRNSGSTSVEELIDLALNTEGSEAARDLLKALLSRPRTELLGVVKHLLEDGSPQRRQLGLDILGRAHSYPNRISPDDSLPLVLPMLEQESDPSMLSAVGWALGQIMDPRAVTPLLRLKNHPDADVRYGVVQGLLGQEDAQAIAALIELSGDPDPEVRDLATYHLMISEEVDTPAMRDAFWARVSDENNETRGEALVGLAERGDPRVIDPLLQELARQGDDIHQLAFKAAIQAGMRIGDSRLYPYLLRLREYVESDGEGAALDAAIGRCAPYSLS